MKARFVMAQLDFTVGAVAGNARRVVETVCHARDELGAQAVIFPELALSGYPPEDLVLRPGFLRAIRHGLDQVISGTQGIDVVVGFPEVVDEGVANSAALIRDGAVRAIYRKQCLPNYSVFDEVRYFVPGTEPCVMEIGGIPAGITICEDLWHAGPARAARNADARLLLNLNASPYHLGKNREREAILSARAKENGLPILYVNLVGGQDELVFDGESMACDPEGRLTHRADSFREALIPVDVFANGDVRPVSGAIAPDLVDEESVWRALVCGLRDYVRKNGFKGAVLGLSGGIDSALVLALAVEALGAEQVLAVLMPSRYTAPMSIEDAEAEARALNVHHVTLPIEPVFAAFSETLAPVFTGRAPDITEENLQARCRGVLLMALSNKEGRILLTTGNKSELSVGYATLYGDMAGGFAPIKDLSKQWVYRLARWRNTQGRVIPERVIERPPSAELRPDQRDSDSLPPYELLDPVLELYVEQDRSVDEIVAAGYDRALVMTVARMVDRAEYKRRQAPPGVRITRRAFGRDRRYPVTNAYSGG